LDKAHYRLGACGEPVPEWRNISIQTDELTPEEARDCRNELFFCEPAYATSVVGLER
jgi:hypothetical protein